MGRGEPTSITLSCEGLDRPEKVFDLKEGTILRIGRSPVSDLYIEHRGVSQHHCELRFESGKLLVRDLSSNGTGLKAAGSKEANGIKKDSDVSFPKGSTLVVPMRVKENQGNRVWINVAMQGSGPAPPAAASEPAASGSEDDDEESRKAFVQLLLQTSEISGNSTYRQAEKILSSQAAWKACADKMRRESFEIFVGHLKDTKTKKKDKKKDKEKAKDTKRDKDKDARKRSRSASPEVRGRHGKKSKRARRSESGGGA